MQDLCLELSARRHLDSQLVQPVLDLKFFEHHVLIIVVEDAVPLTELLDLQVVFLRETIAKQVLLLVYHLVHLQRRNYCVRL